MKNYREILQELSKENGWDSFKDLVESSHSLETVFTAVEKAAETFKAQGVYNLHVQKINYTKGRYNGWCLSKLARNDFRCYGDGLIQDGEYLNGHSDKYHAMLFKDKAEAESLRSRLVNGDEWTSERICLLECEETFH